MTASPTQFSGQTSTSSPTTPRRTLFLAFTIGAVVHLVLWGLSLSEIIHWATFLLLIFALPGALVDISSEMIHPSQTGSILLVALATVANGVAYALAMWCVQWISRRRQSKAS